METVIEAIGLSKSWGRTQAVQNLDLKVYRGEFLALLGANGAGKTTTLECVLGTAKKDAGTISILGMDPVRDRKAIFERVGVQFQQGAFQEKIRVDEACRVQASLYRTSSDWEELLERFGLADKRRSLVADLSGGEKQKLMIVLALIPDPDLLFLDELTTGLDPRSRRTVWEILLEFKRQGKTALITSHFMDEVEHLCDRVIILRRGRVVEEDTCANLIEKYQTKNLEDAFLAIAEEDEFTTTQEELA